MYDFDGLSTLPNADDEIFSENMAETGSFYLNLMNLSVENEIEFPANNIPKIKLPPKE